MYEYEYEYLPNSICVLQTVQITYLSFEWELEMEIVWKLLLERTEASKKDLIQSLVIYEYLGKLFQIICIVVTCTSIELPVK